MNQAVSALQARIKRQSIQPLYNKYLKTVRQNYDEPTLKKMASPYRADELKAAWTDKMREMTIYNKPINKLKKHELYHELLNVNYDFSNLEKRQSKSKTDFPLLIKRRGRPTLPTAPSLALLSTPKIDKEILIKAKQTLKASKPPPLPKLYKRPRVSKEEKQALKEEAKIKKEMEKELKKEKTNQIKQIKKEKTKYYKQANKFEDLTSKIKDLGNKKPRGRPRKQYPPLTEEQIANMSVAQIRAYEKKAVKASGRVYV
jgi:hypothetical protein